MTFSIVARCETSGQVGMAVTSSSLCVASRCLWTRWDAGVVATQNLTDPSLGPLGLDLMASGRSAEQALAMLVAGDPGHPYRQLQLMDRKGGIAQYTGSKALPIVAGARGRECAAAGNLLADAGVPQAMVAAFEGAPDRPLVERLLAALQAGLEAGGEERVLRSAGVQVSDCQSWPVVDLRIDDRPEPIAALASLCAVYEPLMPGYVSRATRPDLY